MAGASIGDLAVYVSADTGPAEKRLRGFGTHLDALDRHTRRVGRDAFRDFHRQQDRYGAKGGDGASLLAGLGKAGGYAAAAVAAARSIRGAFGGVERSIDLAAAAERNAMAFEVMLGSAEKAAAVLRDLRRYAADSPFNSAQVTGTAQRLFAFGVEADQLVPTIRVLGDVASGTGGDLDLMALAFGQVKTQGRLMGQELNQFANQGVPLIENLAAVMKQPQERIKGLVEEGRVGFPEVVQAFNRMTAAGGKFAGMSDRYAETFQGLKDRAVDSLQALGRDVGAALIEDLNLKGWAREGIEAVDRFRGKFAEWRPLLRNLGRMGDLLLVTLKASERQFHAVTAAGMGFLRGFFPATHADPFKGWRDSLDAIDWLAMAERGVIAFGQVGRPAARFLDQTIDGFHLLGDAIDRAFDRLKLFAPAFAAAGKLLPAAAGGLAGQMDEIGRLMAGAQAMNAMKAAPARPPSDLERRFDAGIMGARAGLAQAKEVRFAEAMTRIDKNFAGVLGPLYMAARGLKPEAAGMRVPEANALAVLDRLREFEGGRGRMDARLSPAEYGTQEFVRLTQAATAGANAQRDVPTLLRLMKEADDARAKEQAELLQQIRDALKQQPAVVKLPGDP